MNAEQKINIHNRFDVEVRDAMTGDLKQRLYAENIVLDAMWSRLANRNTYFVNIHFGTGTGTLAASRTTLFTHLGTKVAVNDAQTKALPTSSWRQKIVLNPEEYVGSALSEVGIAYGATNTNLVTHALLRDMNGNVITLIKTALDVVTIYGTVYVTFSTTNALLKICDIYGNRNPLVNYLIGATAFPTLYFFTGQSRRVGGKNTRGLMADTLFKSGNLTLTADVANKKFSTDVRRLAVGESNGHIKEICIGDTNRLSVARLELPAAGIYSGLDLVGVTVGIGNGVTDDFVFPSSNVDFSTVVIYEDGVEQSGVSFSDLEQRAFVGSLSTPLTVGTAISTAKVLEDDVTLVWSGGNRDISSCGVFKLVDGGYVRQTIPSPADAYQYAAVSMSRDGTCFAIVTTVSPYFRAYDLVGAAWVERVQATSTFGNATPAFIEISGDGNTVAIVQTESPYLMTFRWNGSAWTTIPTPVAGLKRYGRRAILSADGNRMAVGMGEFSYPSYACRVSVYDWSGSVWSKIAEYNWSAGSDAEWVDLTPDGLVLSLGQGTVYDWSGSAFVQRPAITISGVAAAGAMSSDGVYLAVMTSDTLKLWVYKWTGSAWLTEDAGTYTGPTNWISFLGAAVMSNDGKTLFTDGAVSGTTGIFTLDKVTPQIAFNTPPATGAVITADYTVNGIHKTAQRVIDLSMSITFGEVV